MPDIHVVPLNDVVQHRDWRQCWCRPRVDEILGEDAVVVHHSADGREYFEPGYVPEAPNA